MHIRHVLLTTTVILRMVGLTALMLTVTDPSIANAATTDHAELSFFGIAAYLKDYFINFFLFVSLMFLLLRKKVASGWQHRQELIEQAVNKGKIEMAAAQQLLAEVQQRLSALEANKINVSQTIHREAVEEIKNLQTDTAQRSERLQQQAAEMATAELRSGERVAREEIARMAVQRAEHILTAGITASVDREIRNVAFNEIKSVLS